MVSKFEHLKLPRINIELPRRSIRGSGGNKRTNITEHSKHLLSQISILTEPFKGKTNPFCLNPKLIFKLNWQKQKNTPQHPFRCCGVAVVSVNKMRRLTVFHRENCKRLGANRGLR